MNDLLVNKSLNTVMPIQMTSLKDKLKDDCRWSKDCLDCMEQIGRQQYAANLVLKENYDLIKGRFIMSHYFDREDMFDLTSAVSQEFNLPKYLKHYDITSKGVNIMVGEFIKRPDIFRVKAEDADSTNEKIRVKGELLQSYMMGEINNEITQKLKQQGLDPDKKDFDSDEDKQKYQEEIKQKFQELTPKSIEKYMKYDYRSSAEHWGQAVLDNDKERFNLKEREKEEFEDVLVADRCFSHFYLTPTGYDIETWNPINTFFHVTPEVKYAEDGDWAGRVFYISKAQVIDRYGWKMTEDEIQALYPEEYKNNKGSDVYSEFFNASMFPWDDYRQFANQVNTLGFDPHSGRQLGSIQSLDSFTEASMLDGGLYYFTQRDLVQVTEAYWRSQRKIGKVNLLNPETNQIEVHIVDETFPAKDFDIKDNESTFRDSDEPNTVTWTWVPQVWKGIKINANYNTKVEKRKGMAIYLDMKPNEFQFKGDYNPFNSKLPVCGGIFNNRNGRSMSFVDLMKPYQVFYNVLYNQSYELAQRNNGKFFLMDMNILPNLKDWGGEDSVEKFMSIARAMGIGVVDTRPSNTQGATFHSTNSFQTIDMDESQRISTLINLAMLVEQQAYAQVGITPQRAGQVQASETATGTQQAVNNSYAQTESYFENFYNYKRRKLKMHLDIAQYVASKDDDITLSYVTSDLGQSFIKVNGTELLLKDLGVYIVNSQEAQRQLETTRQLAINNNTTKLPMSKLIAMIKMNSVEDIQKAIEQAEDEQNKAEQANKQQEIEMEQKKIQSDQEDKEKERQWESNENQLDRINKLQIEEIKSLGYIQDGNPEEAITKATELGIAESTAEFDKLMRNKELESKDAESIRKHSLELAKIKQKDAELKLKKEETDKKIKMEGKKIQSDQTIARLNKAGRNKKK